MTKPLVIYHANCADGFGAAFAAWTKFGDDAEYLPLQYGKVPEPQDLRDMVGERDVYVLDFSLPRPGMDELFRSAECVIWLDHHASAFKDHGFTINAPGEPPVTPLTRHDIVLDNNRSGALIAWEYFHPGTEVPMFVKHIDDYDRWQFKLEGTKEFNKALWSYTPWSFEQWREWFYDCEQGFNHSYWADLYNEGAAILRAHNQNVQSVVKGAAMRCRITEAATYLGYFAGPMGDIDEYSEPPAGLAANCPPHLTSDVGHELATQSGTFGLCWALGKDGKVKASLRSNGGYDVSAIAKVFGGGGHKNAAGFETDINTLMGWLK